MSQFQPAFDFIMQYEDPRYAYEAVPDCGAFAISGINSKFFPQQYTEIATIPQNQRGTAVSNFYLTMLWTPAKVGGIADQDIANRVFDELVNGGDGVKLLQRAANALPGIPLAEDGALGPDTLARVNALDPEALLAAYRTTRVAHYKAVEAKNPQDLQYDHEWMKRAQA